jgi:Rne/Rng family ribonuclease
MSKELFISSSPHETKIAVMEDDNLVEVFYQRDTDVGLVGGIYKGRVSRVLPGMQSAFVDIGLERDAFLYVSDFFEDSDEYDRVTTEAEARVARYTAAEPAPPPAATAESALNQVDHDVEPAVSAPAAEAIPPSLTEAPEPVEPANPAAVPAPPSIERNSGSSRPPQSSGGAGPSRWEENRGRGRRRRRGRGFGGRYEPRQQRAPEHRPAEPTPSSGGGIELLPGESLAKYAHLHHDHEAPSTEDATAWGAANEESEVAVSETATGAAGIAEPIEVEEETNSTAQPLEGAPAAAAAADAPETQAEAQSKLGSHAESVSDTKLPSIRAVGEPAEPRLEEEMLAGHLRLASVPEPDAPKHAAGAASAASRAKVVDASLELSEVEETVLTSIASSEAGELGTFGGSASLETVTIQEAEGADTEVDVDVEETSAEGDEEFADEGGDTTEESAEPALAAAEAEEASGAASATPTEGGDRSYTLRDSNQRPRFAPRRGRRGRGRFGRRGTGPEGPGQGPRRPDHPRGGNEQAVQINEVLKEGQEILVQIAKEPLGTKGARITSHIALPGRYLVYMPTIHHIGVSRKIGSEEERLRLRNLILEHRGALAGGIIVRTAASGRSDEELKADVDFLARLWNEIRNRSERTKAPALIHRDLTLVERILRDILSPDFKTVRVDNELEYQNVLDFVDRFQPSLVGHVKLYSKETPIFEEFGVQAEIDKALKPKVWLKSGGYIVINQTEALVAIDVNTGKYVGRTNRLEDTIVKTNIDAVKEIVRQVRLRDLGGIIVIDFIDMDDRRNRAKVVQALEEALRSDRAPTKILSFNEFGLVALTRKRVKQSLERTLSEPCAYCSGSGWIKSVTTVCYEILEEARKMAREIDGDAITLRVNPEVARALKSREGTLTAELESLTGKDVVIKSDPTVHQERFEIF